MKNTFSLFVALLATTIGLSQTNGTVTDEQNNPLPGASVVIKGTTKGATTNFDGVFSINANPGDILVISYVGFETQEAAVGQGPVNIILQ